MSPTSTFMSGFSTGLYYFEISNHQQCDHKSRRLHLALLRVYCRSPSSKYCDASRVATYIFSLKMLKPFAWEELSNILQRMMTQQHPRMSGLQIHE